MCDKMLFQTSSRLPTGTTALGSVETRNSTTAAGQDQARMTYYYPLLEKITHESTLVLTCKSYLKYDHHDMVLCPRASGFHALSCRSL